MTSLKGCIKDVQIFKLQDSKRNLVMIWIIISQLVELSSIDVNNLRISCNCIMDRKKDLIKWEEWIK
jgi:hypothetical protein